MKYQIKKIEGSQTAKVLAIVLGILSIIPLLVMVFPMMLVEDISLAAKSSLIFFPILHFIMAYIFIRLFSFIYNKVSDKVGGIEIELSNDEIQEK
jgi:hypothetical protein